MKKDLLAIGVLLVIISCFCSEILLENRSPFRGDIAEQFYPWKVYVKDTVLNGELPYWNPYTFGGAPLLANMQSGVFYPLDWALLLAFPIERFYGLSLWLHLCLAGIGAFLLAKKCGADSFPALLGGVAYGLNGFTMIHIPAGNHLTYAAAAWVPWMLWAASGYVQSHTKKIKWALIGLGITFLHFLCGHPQMAFYSLFFCMLFCTVYTIWLHHKIEGRPLFFSILRIISWGIVLVLGIFLAGFQLIPTLEYAGLANRAAQLDLAAATEFSFAPHRIITLLFPEYYGTSIAANHYDTFVFWSCAYAGVVVPVLAIVALVKKPRTNVVLPLFIIGFVGLLLAWGRGNPIYTLWFQLPGFGSFRAPAKYLPYYLTAVCTLASLGLDKLCNEAYKQLQERPPIATPIQRFAMLIACLLVVFVYGPQVFSQMIDNIRQLDGITEQIYIRAFSVANGMCMLLAGFTLYLLSRNIPHYPRLAVSASVIALLILDLFVYGRGYLLASNLMNETQMKLVSAAPQEVGYIQSLENGNPYRVATLSDLYAPNQAIHWKIRNIAGYDPMSLKTYNQQIAQSESWKPGEYHDNIQLENFEHSVLDQLNIKYILTNRIIGDDTLNFLFAGQDFRVYERTSEDVSWAWSVNDDDIQIAYGFPEPGAFYTNSVPPNWQPVSSLNVTEYKPHSIQFSVTLDSSSWLKVSEWDYPGWIATAKNKNGEVLEIYIESITGGFRTFPIPSGTWHITMEYTPPIFGWVLSFLTILIVIGLLFIDRMIASGTFFRYAQKLMGRDY